MLIKKKTYKDLSIEEELELVLWLAYLKESLNNAKRQMIRWNRLKRHWDIEMFINAVIYIDNAIIGLKKFLNYGQDYISESQLWNVLKQFRKEVAKYNLKDLRDDLVHREKIFRLKDRRWKPLPASSILILGGYNFTTDEYQFGPNHKIKISEIFAKVKKLRQDIAEIYAGKLKNFYASENNEYESMVPFTNLHDFSYFGNLSRNKSNLD